MASSADGGVAGNLSHVKLITLTCARAPLFTFVHCLHIPSEWVLSRHAKQSSSNYGFSCKHKIHTSLFLWSGASFVNHLNQTKKFLTAPPPAYPFTLRPTQSWVAPFTNNDCARRTSPVTERVVCKQIRAARERGVVLCAELWHVALLLNEPCGLSWPNRRWSNQRGVPGQQAAWSRQCRGINRELV